MAVDTLGAKPIALLFDGDIFAFQACAAAEKPVDWGNGIWTLHTDINAAKAKAVNNMEEIFEDLGASVAIFAVTDKQNWRYDVLPTYKQNRVATRKPMCLNEVKDYLKSEYVYAMEPGMEADDVMGILSTDSEYLPGYQKIIVSIDKDMQTIPGWLYNPSKDPYPRYITEQEANHYHLTQSISGDVTDGYNGANGFGTVTADALLLDGLRHEPYDHTFKSGARKGETETRWKKVESPSPWDTVLSCYAKAGQTQTDALQNAQVARICRVEDYDKKNQKVIPWTPTRH